METEWMEDPGAESPAFRERLRARALIAYALAFPHLAPQVDPELSRLLSQGQVTETQYRQFAGAGRATISLESGERRWSINLRPARQPGPEPGPIAGQWRLSQLVSVFLPEAAKTGLEVNGQFVPAELYDEYVLLPGDHYRVPGGAVLMQATHIALAIIAVGLGLLAALGSHGARPPARLQASA